jgi:hypothetical protein
MGMTEQLLNVICAVQDCKKFIISKNMMNNEKTNWYKETQQFYFSIDDEVINASGLNKNINNYEKVLRYPVNDEILNTSYDELYQFQF